MAESHGIGKHLDTPQEGAVAAPHAVTTDPVALGDALGLYLADVQEGHTYFVPMVQLLRAAGAAEAAAATQAAWVRAAWRRCVQL